MITNSVAVGLIGGVTGFAIGYCAYRLVQARGMTMTIWVLFEGIFAVFVILCWIMIIIIPQDAAPRSPDAGMLSRAAWELLLYVFVTILAVNTALLPLFIVAVLVRTRPESARVYLPIGGILAGLLLGGVLAWALARHVNGLGDVFTIIGTCTGVFGGMGVGIEYLIPREKT